MSETCDIALDADLLVLEASHQAHRFRTVGIAYQKRNTTSFELLHRAANARQPRGIEQSGGVLIEYSLPRDNVRRIHVDEVARLSAFENVLEVACHQICATK